MEIGLLYGIVESSKTRVRCLFCGVHIPKATRCIEQHNNGTKHKENMKLMYNNGLSFINDALYCKPCKRTLPVEECVWKHIEAYDHLNWMIAIENITDGETISLDAYLSGESDAVNCEVCDVNFNCSLPLIEAHVNSTTHRSHMITRLKPMNGIFTVANNKAWCKVCDKYFDDDAEAVFNHIDDDFLHMQWFMDMDDLIENEDVSVRAFLANQNENCAYCSNCQVDVICNVHSIRTHVNSIEHINHHGL